MTRHVVLSFWVDRPDLFPLMHRKNRIVKPPPYLAMLKVLDASCRRFGFEHIVLTDYDTAPRLHRSKLTYLAADLPHNLMKAFTDVEARWLESPQSIGVDSIFVGADCIIRRDFRADVPACDLAIAYMKGHKKWRMNNGFMYVRAGSREKVALLFRRIAGDTGEEMCDDMLAIERALLPMPPEYGVFDRRGLSVAFLPLPIWNCYVKTAADPASQANVMHFMGGWEDGKALLFKWAARHGFANA